MAMHTWFECKIRYEKTMENGMHPTRRFSYQDTSR